jgi:hypothetical protein
MKTRSYNLTLTFDQILELVRQLPKQQKVKLAKELEKEAIDKKLTKLLDSFKTEELSMDDIDQEAGMVRQEIYTKNVSKSGVTGKKAAN